MEHIANTESRNRQISSAPIDYSAFEVGGQRIPYEATRTRRDAAASSGRLPQFFVGDNALPEKLGKKDAPDSIEERSPDGITEETNTSVTPSSPLAAQKKSETSAVQVPLEKFIAKRREQINARLYRGLQRFLPENQRAALQTRVRNYMADQKHASPDSQVAQSPKEVKFNRKLDRYRKKYSSYGGLRHGLVNTRHRWYPQGQRKLTITENIMADLFEGLRPEFQNSLRQWSRMSLARPKNISPAGMPEGRVNARLNHRRGGVNFAKKVLIDAGARLAGGHQILEDVMRGTSLAGPYEDEWSFISERGMQKQQQKRKKGSPQERQKKENLPEINARDSELQKVLKAVGGLERLGQAVTLNGNVTAEQQQQYIINQAARLATRLSQVLTPEQAEQAQNAYHGNARLLAAHHLQDKEEKGEFGNTQVDRESIINARYGSTVLHAALYYISKSAAAAPSPQSQ